GHAALLQDRWQYMPTMAECRCLPGERARYGCGKAIWLPKRETHERKAIMARSLQDKLATIDSARRTRVEAEADRLREEYLNMQQSPERQDDKRSDTDSDPR